MSPVPDPVEPGIREASGSRLFDRAGIPFCAMSAMLVRPHPERVREWNGVSIDGLDNVVVNGRNPIDADAKADYFDSLYHSAAGCRPLHDRVPRGGDHRPAGPHPAAPRMRMHQDGMLHFRYLAQRRRRITAHGP